MSFPVAYGKTKLVSAVGGESILDAGDLNYSVERILLTDTNTTQELPMIMSSFYAVSRTGNPSGLSSSTIEIPNEWFSAQIGQHDGRNTGWRIRVHFTGSETLIVSLKDAENITLSNGDLVDFIYAPAMVAGLVINGDEGMIPVAEFVIHFLNNRTVV